MNFSTRDLSALSLDDQVNAVEQTIAEKMLKEFGGSIESAFSFADEDSSGSIDEAEFRVLLRRLDIHVDDDVFDALMERFDDDGNRAISASEFELRYRFQRDRFVKFLTQRQEEKELLLSTPYTILFFLVFVVLLYARDRTPQMYAVGNGFKANVFDVPSASSGVAFEDIHNAADFFEYAEEALIPQAMVQANPFAKGIPLVEDEWGKVSLYGSIMGTGIIIEQHRSVTEDCVGPLGNLSGSCYTTGPLINEAAEEAVSSYPNILPICNGAVNTSCYDASHLDAGALATVLHAFEYNNETASYMFKLEISKPIAWNQQIIAALRDLEWLDRKTRQVTARFATFNGEISVFSLAEFNLEQVAGGYFIPSIPRTNSVRSAVYSEFWLFGLEGVWLLLVLLNAVTEFRELCEAANENDGDCTEYFTEDGWNYVDWVQIFLAIATSVFFFIITSDIASLTDEYVAWNETLVEHSSPEPLLAHLVSILGDLAVYRGIALINMVVLLLRFFKAFRGQPRLAVITRTFVIAGVDICHFMLIFFCILMSFVASAVFLFGQHVYRYHAWIKALGWCFWSLTGEFFWDEVHQENAVMALAWWWLYLLVMYLVLTNMLVAMILDAFNTANHEQKSKVSMVQQIVDIFRNGAAVKKGCIQLDEMIEYLEGEFEMDDDGDDNDDQKEGNPKDSKQEESKSETDKAAAQTGEEDDNEFDPKALSEQKLISLSDIVEMWKVVHAKELTRVAEQVTEKFVIALLRDFCLWNQGDDDEMRLVLEKNALSKLVAMDQYFEPIQDRMKGLQEQATRLIGEANNAAAEVEPIGNSELQNL